MTIIYSRQIKGKPKEKNLLSGIRVLINLSLLECQKVHDDTLKFF